MTDEQYRARIYSIEWHARLAVQHDGAREGSPYWVLIESVMAYCTQCVEADFYGVARPEPPNDECRRAIDAFEKMWMSPGPAKF